MEKDFIEVVDEDLTPLEQLEVIKFRTTKRANGSIAIQQTDQRKVKQLVHKHLIESIGDTVEINEVQNALLLEYTHEEWGAIVVELKAIIKPLDFDSMTLIDEWQEKQEKAKAKK